MQRQTRDTYFVIFVGLFFTGMALLALRAFNDSGSLLDATLGVWSDTAPLTITAAAAALALTEIGRSIVVIARRLEEGLERIREQRRAEGRAEAHREWRAWNQRRVEAEERGERFTEPPPTHTR